MIRNPEPWIEIARLAFEDAVPGEVLPSHGPLSDQDRVLFRDWECAAAPRGVHKCCRTSETLPQIGERLPDAVPIASFPFSAAGRRPQFGDFAVSGRYDLLLPHDQRPAWTNATATELQVIAGRTDCRLEEASVLMSAAIDRHRDKPNREKA